MPGRVVIQWDKDDCADLGIIKVDLLGLGMLAVLEEVVPMIREHEGVEVDLAHLPAGRPRGLRHDLPRRHRRRLPGREPRPDGHAAAHAPAALLRPRRRGGDHPARARSSARWSTPTSNRRIGRETVDYPHPDLEPILERTLGVPLFQEQLMRIAMVAAGFTGGQAEELRRAMGSKRSVERMRKIEQQLREGMAARGITGAAADEIVQGITSFALYGFPESHAASLRAHRLRLGLPQGAPPGGVPVRAPQRLADGLLPPRDPRPGRPAPRRARAADRRVCLAVGVPP